MAEKIAKAPLEDGVHPVIERDRYDRLDRRNFSTLKWLAKSPRHYRQVLLAKSEDTDPKRFGRVVHVAAFEPDRFRNSIAVWDGKVRSGKDWDAFKERNAGLELLTVKQYEACRAVQSAVQNDPIAQSYLQNGRGEQTLLWSTEAGGGKDRMTLLCKGRPDFIGARGMVDLKTTSDASPFAFGRRAASLLYHVQAAYYRDAYEQITGERPQYTLVAVETTAPYVVQCHVVTEPQIAKGREVYRAWLDTLAFCLSNSVWPAYREGDCDLELPAWVMGDAGEIGLDFGEADDA